MRRVVLAAASIFAITAPAVAQQPAGPSAWTGLRMHEVRLATGIRMHYAAQGDPAGRPVILMHGYTDSWFTWSRVLPLLPADWRVHAVDLRGHGDSDKPVGGYTQAEMSRDVLAFMDALGIARATIVGHSGGGLILQRLMADAPERVERAVIVSSMATGHSITDVAGFREAVLSLTDPVDPAFARAFQESTVALPVPAPFMDTIIAQSLKLPARVWHDYLNGVLADPPIDALRETWIPTLIFWGDRDAVVSRQAADELNTLIRGSRLLTYEGIGHAPNWEVPERFVADLVHFVTAR